MIELDERAILPKAPQYNASLVARLDETESLGYFTVKFDGEATPFEPGQYMTIATTPLSTGVAARMRPSRGSAQARGRRSAAADHHPRGTAASPRRRY